MRIAIVKLSALGDIVHAMIVLQLIKKSNNEISIDWVVEEKFKELLDSHPHINQVHSVKLRSAKKKKSIFLLYKELKKFKKLDSFDLVIDMQGLIKSALISKLIPSKQTIGFDKFSARESIASSFYDKTFNCRYDKNVILRNIELLEFSLRGSFNKKQIDSKNPYLYSKEHELNVTLSKSKKNILLILGASNESKRYPAYKLGEMTKLIDANFLVIWGNTQERNLASQIKEISPKIHICNNLSIGSLINLISEVDLVIGPDTGPTHMAWALNVPSIVLFGSTPGYRNTYQTPINRIIESKSNVDPLKIKKDDFSIDQISPREILRVVKEIFNN
jgi:heptosyltransferase I